MKWLCSLASGATNSTLGRDVVVAAGAKVLGGFEVGSTSDSVVGYGGSRGAQSELSRLRAENARLKEDLEILKKAAKYFAREQQ